MQLIIIFIIVIINIIKLFVVGYVNIRITVSNKNNIKCKNVALIKNLPQLSAKITWSI